MKDKDDILDNTKYIKDLLRQSNEKSKYLTFGIAEEQNPKTFVFDVSNTDEDIVLGQVKYYANWRQYSFFPSAGTVFEKSCMQDITDFIINVNSLHKIGLRTQATLD